MKKLFYASILITLSLYANGQSNKYSIERNQLLETEISKFSNTDKKYSNNLNKDISKSNLKSSSDNNNFGFGEIKSSTYNFSLILYSNWYWYSNRNFETFHSIKEEYSNSNELAGTFMLTIHNIAKTADVAADADIISADLSNAKYYSKKESSTFANQFAYYNSYVFVYNNISFSIDSWSFKNSDQVYTFDLLTTVDDWNLNKTIYSQLIDGIELTLFKKPASFTDTISVLLLDTYTKIVSVNGTNVNIKLFPNPAKDKITIETSKRIQSLIIENTTGQTIKTFNNIDASSIQFDINDLSNGVYLFKVVFDSGSIIQKVIIEK